MSVATAYERAWETPAFSTTRFSTENSHWKQSHDRPNAYGVAQLDSANNYHERPQSAIA